METKKTLHKFYCDGCGKYLGSSEEYSDGFYYERGGFEYSVCISDRWFNKKAHYCDECGEEFEQLFIKTLKGLGFK